MKRKIYLKRCIGVIMAVLLLSISFGCSKNNADKEDSTVVSRETKAKRESKKTEKTEKTTKMTEETLVEETEKLNKYPEVWGLLEYETKNIDDWYGHTTDDERVAMIEHILGLMEECGLDMDSFDAETMTQEINDYYSSEYDLGSILTAVLVMTEMEITDVVDIYFFSDTGEYEWYGLATDAQRVALGEWLRFFLDAYTDYDDVFSISFADEINAYYDIDKSESIWYVACEIVENMSEEIYYGEWTFAEFICAGIEEWYACTDDDRITMAENILSELESAYYSDLIDVSGWDEESLAEEINYLFDNFYAPSILDAALDVLGANKLNLLDISYLDFMYLDDWLEDSNSARLATAILLLEIHEIYGSDISEWDRESFEVRLTTELIRDDSLTVWGAANWILSADLISTDFD